MKPSNPTSDQDFTAAMHEVESNLQIRRLMFVTSNVLVPSVLLASADFLAGSQYPPALRWLPEHILAISGALLAISGLIIAAVLARCEFGMVVNGSKMRKVTSGELSTRGLNLLGVTSNFAAVNAVASSAGVLLLSLACGLGAWSISLAILPFLLIFLMLEINHERGNELCRQLTGSWQHVAVDRELLETHARQSLEATSADISVVVTMATALFAGSFATMSNIGAVSPKLALQPTAAQIHTHGIPALAIFALLSLLLSMRMIVRLRIALAEHSERLSQLRNEEDRPWHFRILERSYLLYLLLQLQASILALIIAWNYAGFGVALLASIVLALAGLAWYPLRLAAAARKAAA